MTESALYYGSIPDDIELPLDVAQGRDKDGNVIPAKYAFADMLRDFVLGDPKWQSSVDWLDTLDVLVARLARKPAGTPWTLEAEHRTKLLDVMRAPARQIQDGLRPCLSPFFRAVMCA